MRVSLRDQILLLLLATVVIAVGATLAIGAVAMRRDKLAFVYQGNVELADTLAEQVRATLEGTVERLRYLGGALAESDRRHGEDQESAAQAFFRADPEALSLDLFERSGEQYVRLLHQVNRPRLSALQLEEGELREAERLAPLDLPAIAAEGHGVENVSLPPDLPLLRVAARVGEAGRIVVETFRPDRFLRVFGQPNLGHAFLVDARGRTLVDPDANAVLAHRDRTAHPLVHAAQEPGFERGVHEFSTESGAMIGAFAKVKGTRLTVQVETPREAALRPVRELARQTVLVGTLVLALAVVATVFFARRITAPLRTLGETMAQVSSGNLGAEAAIHRRDEVGELAEAFNRMSRQLREREQALAEAHAELVQSEKLSALGELSAGLVHEVKNPMVGISGFAELGASAQTLEEAKGWFAQISDDARRANEILMRLLDFARPEPTRPVPLDLNAVLQSALALVRHPLQLSRVKVETALADGLPRVEGDPNQLRQVAVNLLVNAVQALEAAPEKRLRVVTRVREDGRVEAVVEDSGPGMSEEVKRNLFRPFYTTKPRGRGTGLGLSVSRKIALAHKGDLRVESVAGKGSSFVLVLPRSEDRPG